ncbi:MAG: peroxiredoxin [Ignavibacteriaceae bacterium]
MKLLSLVFVFLFCIIIVNAQDENKKEEKMSSLSAGMEAPDFTLQDASGKEYTLSSYKGESPVVVYFYPKANTSGCTKQACGIRDDWSKFEKNNIKVFGISTDPKEDIKKFVDDHNLNFPLLSDSDKKVSAAYKVLNENGMDKRVTFVIDKEGKIAEIFQVDDIDNHSAKVYDIASKLN